VNPRASAARVAAKALLSLGLVAILIAWSDAGRLWALARDARPSWLAAALVFYGATIAVSAWRWGVLLEAQRVRLRRRTLGTSFLVATFFNNFLPSNIGGDVVRVTDTAGAAGSKTLAATVVLVDRGLGVLALGLVAAAGATLARTAGPVAAPVLWTAVLGAAAVAVTLLARPSAVATLLAPIKRLHPAWIDERLARLTGALERFREQPAALAGGFAGALAVQALLVLFYAAIARALSVPVRAADLAVVVPASFFVQMLPISLNGLGVREATFGLYFARVGLPLESALLVSLAGAALVLPFSVAGAGLYAARSRRRPQTLDSQPATLYSEGRAPHSTQLP
jgi:hypothetical protein